MTVELEYSIPTDTALSSEVQDTCSDSMSFNSANGCGQLLQTVTLTLLDRTDVFNMPSWDIALCQLVNVEPPHDTYLVKWPIVLLYLRDKFRDRPHVHIVFHLASRLFAATRPA